MVYHGGASPRELIVSLSIKADSSRIEHFSPPSRGTTLCRDTVMPGMVPAAPKNGSPVGAKCDESILSPASTGRLDSLRTGNLTGNFQFLALFQSRFLKQVVKINSIIQPLIKYSINLFLLCISGLKNHRQTYARILPLSRGDAEN
jgi:hypothetical protein